MADIQWFPGHMTKAMRKIKEDLKLVDIIIEIIDARVPLSSRNPAFIELIKRKPRITLINKADLADPAVTPLWFSCLGSAIVVNCQSGAGINLLPSALKSILKNEINSWQSKGMIGKCIRAMVIGVPNVGKSSFINRVVSQKRAKVEDRPGVTRGNQWFKAKGNLEIIDTPGMLWHKFEDQTQGENLAIVGSIKSEILDSENLAKKLIQKLMILYPAALENRFNLSFSNLACDEILTLIGKKRGMLLTEAQIDLPRASNMLLDEFRNAKLGRITLEQPNTQRTLETN